MCNIKVISLADLDPGMDFTILPGGGGGNKGGGNENGEWRECVRWVGRRERGEEKKQQLICISNIRNYCRGQNVSSVCCGSGSERF